MDKELNLPRITGTIVDSPAEAAGFKANDIIYKVDGQSVQGMTLQEAVSLIRGEKGTSVVVTIYREGESGYLDIEVTRDEVKTQTVNTTMMDDGIGYLGITEFDSVTPDQFKKGMEELRSQDMKALIIDLRSNPGGVLSAVCEIAEELLPKGVIVYTIDRDGNRDDNLCSGEHEIDIPVVVLVNGYSASASEILSGAMKDYGKATLVGETTYGKGVVQRIFKFSDGTAVKLTISSYYTPNGTNINGVGIEPDVEIELDTEAYAKDGTDNQLDKAVEILQKELKK
jgi:carboxyl-terminal processing protease